MQNFLRLATPLLSGMKKLMPIAQKPFSFKAKIVTQTDVENYKTPRPELTDYFAQEQADNEELKSILHRFFIRNYQYQKLTNSWKNELIRKDKKRERKMQRIAEKVSPVDEEPKLVVHSQAVDQIELNDQLKYDSFAIIKLKGFQHKVLADDLLIVHRIEELSVGDTIEVSDVHLVGNKYFTILGRPLVTNAKVLLNLEENTFSKKVIVFKKRRRKGYKRNMGFSHPISVFRVLSVEYDIPQELAQKAVRLC